MKSAEEFLKTLTFDQSADAEESPPSKEEGLFSSEPIEELAKKVESRAVYLLGMREHGAKELKTKLLTKFPETEALLSECQEIPGFMNDLIDDVLQRCQANNWQSDERYIEQSVRNWAAKGTGPIKIHQKLQQATDRDDLIALYLDWDDREWLELVLDVLIKKYGDTQRPTEQKEQARRMRFLQSRGFSSEVIWKAFREHD